jgi:hypothetical protein
MQTIIDRAERYGCLELHAATVRGNAPGMHWWEAA